MVDNNTILALTQVESRLFLDVIVRKGAAILQLLAGEDQALLIRRNTLLILNLVLHVVEQDTFRALSHLR